MSAFGFKRRFIEPIREGLKRQTVRRIRKDGRTARPGEELQLYYAMRTRQCELIGRSICRECLPIEMWLSTKSPTVLIAGHPADPGPFAYADGFTSWPDLLAFWDAEHPGVHHFAGTLTTWGDLL